jgi:hypothetical protein
MPEPNFMKLGMYIMATEPISTAYFINPSHQSLCLYVYPTIVARQRLGKNITAATNTHTIIGELLDASFSMQSVLYQRKSRWSVLPRTYCFYVRHTIMQCERVALPWLLQNIWSLHTVVTILMSSHYHGFYETCDVYVPFFTISLLSRTHYCQDSYALFTEE